MQPCLCPDCCRLDPRRQELRARRDGEAAALRRALGTRDRVLSADRPRRASKVRKAQPATKPRRASARPVPPLGQRLRAAREAAGLAQAEVAARLGLEAASTISAWESCRSPVPPDRRAELAQVLAVKVGDLFPPGEPHRP